MHVKTVTVVYIQEWHTADNTNVYNKFIDY